MTSRPTGAAVWLLAARPATLTAALAPVVVGSAMAHAVGRFALMPAVAALFGAVMIQIGTNFANDYHDFRRGSDREDRVGPVRVTQAGFVEPERVLRAAVFAFGLAALAGLYLVAVAGWPILVIGVASVAAGFAYTAGPYPLAYHGLGELFVLLFFGLVAVAGTYYVQALEFRADLLLAGVGVGALSSAILVVNNLRDREADALSNKRTLAVVLGEGGSRIEFVLLLVVAAAVPLVGVFAFGWSGWTLLALAALLRAAPPLVTVFTAGEPSALNPALVGVARVLISYSLLLSVGFILA